MKNSKPQNCPECGEMLVDMSSKMECPNGCRVEATKDTTTQQQAKFTPGPWIVEGLDILGANGNAAVAKVNSMLEPKSAEIQANARLIASAPELLSTLKGMYSGWLKSGLGRLKQVETILDKVEYEGRG